MIVNSVQSEEMVCRAGGANEAGAHRALWTEKGLTLWTGSPGDPQLYLTGKWPVRSSADWHSMQYTAACIASSLFSPMGLPQFSQTP
jgi:hypothetical protein